MSDVSSVTGSAELGVVLTTLLSVFPVSPTGHSQDDITLEIIDAIENDEITPEERIEWIDQACEREAQENSKNGRGTNDVGKILADVSRNALFRENR